MPSFSIRSKTNLASCDIRLQNIFNEVIKYYDCTIIEGHRNQAMQDKYFIEKKSKVIWPNSKHNSRPSKAVDVAPYPIDWGDKVKGEARAKVLARFYHFAGYVLRVADQMNIKIRWGGDWNSNKIFTDQNFDDLPHFELVD